MKQIPVPDASLTTPDPLPKEPFLFLPHAQDGDSRDSSLVVYTITVAIAISLLIFVFSVDRKIYWSVLLSFVSAALYLIAAIKTFLAIEYLVDITSFRENNTDDEKRFDKYKKILLRYNWSIILIIGATILVFYNIVFKYLIALKASDDKWINLFFDFLLLVLAGILTNRIVRKWKKDINYVREAVHRPQNPVQRATPVIPGFSKRTLRRPR